jgi:hypothetical protein
MPIAHGQRRRALAGQGAAAGQLLERDVPPVLVEHLEAVAELGRRRRQQLLGVGEAE